MPRARTQNRVSAGAYAAANMPVNSVLPAISGDPTVGETLTSSSGTWSKSPSFTYQWQADGNAVAGATSSAFELTEAQTGKAMRCTVKATKSGVSAVAVSASTEFISDAGALPGGATGFVDFVNLTFYTEGGIEDIDDILADDPNWNFDPANVVEGVGLVGTQTSSKVRIIGTLEDQILAGATVVFNCSFDDDPLAYFSLMGYDDPDFNLTWQCNVASDLGAVTSNVTADAPGTTFSNISEGAHRVAWTIQSSGVKISVDGGAVVADAGTGSDFLLLNAAGLEVGQGAILQSIAVYPPKSDAEMQALSAI